MSICPTAPCLGQVRAVSFDLGGGCDSGLMRKAHCSGNRHPDALSSRPGPRPPWQDGTPVCQGMKSPRGQVQNPCSSCPVGSSRCQLKLGQMPTEFLLLLSHNLNVRPPSKHDFKNNFLLSLSLLFFVREFLQPKWKPFPFSFQRRRPPGVTWRPLPASPPSTGTYNGHKCSLGRWPYSVCWFYVTYTTIIRENRAPGKD